MSPKSIRRVIEALESRWLFYVYNGTAGPDTIIIRSAVDGPGQYVSVQINGAAPVTTGTGVVQINALGGNDTVYLPELSRNYNSFPPDISIDLGDGNDYVTNYDPATGVSSTAKLDFGAYIVGGTGSDTLDIDASGGQGMYDQTFAGSQFSWRKSLAIPTGVFYWNSTLESVIADGSSAAETFVLKCKPAAMKLTINANGGNDLILAGYEDYTVSPEVDYNFSGGGWTPGTASVFGGAGTDEIRFFDRTAAAGTYAEDNFTLAKAGTGFTYSTFETQRIEPAPSSTVQFNAMTSAITQTRVWAQQATVNVGNGTLNGLSGRFDLSLSGGGSAININDASDTGNDNYAFTSELVGTLIPVLAGKLEKNPGVSGQIVEWIGPASVTLNSGSGGTGISVRSVLSDTSLVINGGPAADSVAFNAGDVDASILGTVFVNGGSGAAADEMLLDDHLDTTAGLVTLNGPTFTDGTASIASTNIERIIITAGSGPDAAVNVQRVTAETLLSTPSTTPSTVGGGNLESNLLNNLFVTSAGVVTVDDRLDVGNDTYVINGLTFYKGAHYVEMGAVVSAILQANDGDDFIAVQETTSNLLSIHANGGNDRIDVADTANFFGLFTIGVDTGPENPAVAPFGDQLVVNSDAGQAGDAAASVRLLNDDVVNSVDVRAAGRVVVPGGVALRANTISNLGAIDLAGGALLTSGAAAANVPTWLRTGRNGGTWDGSGAGGAIVSSLANTSAAKDGVGYGLGSQVAPASVGTLAVGATDTLIRYTLDGDANLDRTVGFADLVKLAQNYNASGRSWSAGDFDYDTAGTVNFADLVKLAQNYNQTATISALAPPTKANSKRVAASVLS